MGEDSVSGVTGTVSESALLKSDNLFNGAYHKKASSKNSIVVPVPMLLVVCLYECGILQCISRPKSRFSRFCFLIVP